MLRTYNITSDPQQHVHIFADLRRQRLKLVASPAGCARQQQGFCYGPTTLLLDARFIYSKIPTSVWRLHLTVFQLPSNIGDRSPDVSRLIQQRLKTVVIQTRVRRRKELAKDFKDSSLL
jgi:hypothetical protein